LLVEDQESDYQLVRLLLNSIESQRFDLDWIWSVDAAQEAIVRGAHDVCLLDYNLGIDDGIAMLRDCRSRNSQMPVILLTACADYGVDLEAMKAGAADFIIKDQLTPVLLERSIRYATERDRGVAVIRLMQELAAAANEAVSTSHAMQLAVDLFCRFAKWRVGHAFVVAEGKQSGQLELLSTSIWHIDNATNYQMLREATEASSTIPMACHRTLIESAGFVVVDDLSDVPDFQRCREAGLCGLSSYFAFLVSAGDSPAAVLEFFNDSPMTSEDPFVKTSKFAAQQLAHVFKRERDAAELRTSEIRLRSIVQSASDAIILADAEGRILSWNKGAERIFGYAEPEVAGFSMEYLMPQGYRDWHRVAIERQRLSGNSPIVGRTIELEGLRKDGSSFPIELSLASWTAAEGTFFTGIIRDITERKAAVKARRTPVSGRRSA
jgi:PAS domain S-box-containing protein